MPPWAIIDDTVDDVDLKMPCAVSACILVRRTSSGWMQAETEAPDNEPETTDASLDFLGWVGYLVADGFVVDAESRLASFPAILDGIICKIGRCGGRF